MYKIIVGLFALLLVNILFSQTTYTFIGNGYLSMPSNWNANGIPPSVLPVGSSIIISPSPGDTCKINVSQTISAGAGLYISALAIFIIEGGVTLSASIPSLSTKPVANITSNDANGGGIISANGGSPITERGLVWSTSHNPTINLPTKANIGPGAGSYNITITGLQPNTPYFVKAYATNGIGTAYGNEESFTTLEILLNCGIAKDADSNTYNTVIIGGACWTQKNLTTSHYRNGDSIPEVKDLNQWISLTTGAWCWYNNDPNNAAIHGKLYNWYALNDSRGLAPIGYHIPTDAEWATLVTNLGGSGAAGGKMKVTTYWNLPNEGATNTSGFSAIPSGYRANNGPFANIWNYANWWSRTDANPAPPIGAWNLTIVNNKANTYRGYSPKTGGASVRCVKD
jgi:uncharacterized protein (TIGR02145 family)